MKLAFSSATAWTRRADLFLVALAVLGLGFHILSEATRRLAPQDYLQEKMAAATEAVRCFEAIREARVGTPGTLDQENDPEASGLIGQEHTLTTTDRGVLEAKLTTVNPNFAAVFVEYFHDLNLKPGDAVAIALTGSFPALNISMLAAAETMKLKPLVITSVGASMWGANDPGFTWLDMEKLLNEKGLLHTRSLAASVGGSNDRGRGLSPEGRRLLRDAIERNDIPLISEPTLEQSVEKRVRDLRPGGRAEGCARVRQHRRRLGERGERTEREPDPAGREHDAQAVQLDAARRAALLRLQACPDHPPAQCRGDRRRGRTAADARDDSGRGRGGHLLPGSLRPALHDPGVLDLSGALLRRAAGPEPCRTRCARGRDTIADSRYQRAAGGGKELRMRGRRALGPVVLCAVALLIAAVGADSAAAAKKLSNRIRPAASAGSVKILVGKKSSIYHKATKVKPVEFRIKGPATIRIMSRYLFASPELAKTTPYGFRVEIGTTTLRTENRKAGVSKSATLEGGVKIGTLEKSVIRVPTGDHRVRVVPVDPAATIAVRILKGTGKKAAIKWTGFQPDAGPKAVRLHEKDQESTVYRFSSAQPVGVSLRGPLKMRVMTRLDFGLTNGVTQSYVIKATLDGKPWKSFSQKSTASHTATYPELTQITPGKGQSFVLDVPSGPHKIMLELTGTTAGGASVRIQIPQREPKTSTR